MIQKYVDIVIAKKDDLITEFQTPEGRPQSYDSLVKRLVTLLAEDETDGMYADRPDVDRITVIDHGHYQGTRLFVLGSDGYQPSTYWAIFVSYGSCSGCDTFEANRGYGDKESEELAKEAQGNYTMLLHMAQNMKEIS